MNFEPTIAQLLKLRLKWMLSGILWFFIKFFMLAAAVLIIFWLLLLPSHPHGKTATGKPPAVKQHSYLQKPSQDRFSRNTMMEARR